MNDIMASLCFPLYHEFQDYHSLVNPDLCTSAGIVANNYGRFRTNFWIDRILFMLTVLIPVLQGLFLVLMNSILGVTHCLPNKKIDSQEYSKTNVFIDRACGLQLTSEVLQGSIKTVPTAFKAFQSISYESSEVYGKEISTIRLQHECYPFVLLILAIIMWLPHHLYRRSVDRTARRDLCLVRSELHSFRRAIAQELAYLQTVARTSTDTGAPTTTFLSPGSTIPPGPSFQTTALYCPHVPVIYEQNDGTSGRTTAATVGGTSMRSQTPAPTVINTHQQRSTTIGTTRVLTDGVGISPMVSPLLNYGDADLSAPGLIDLPCFHACHIDWSLNTYLSAWQNTEFYWSRYLTKHIVLGIFQICGIITIFTLFIVYKGTPFAALFICQIYNNNNNDYKNSDSNNVYVCMLQTTFLINMSLLSMGFIYLTSLILQIIFFYLNFIHHFWLFTKNSNYMGVQNRINKFTIDSDENKRCFFADYIRLLAYTAFKDTQCEIRSINVNYSSKLYSSDFHFISLLCIENINLLPDFVHIHFWIERYSRLCHKHNRRPYWAIRRGSIGHLVRCEDLSIKFNFSKIKIRVEVNDFGGF